MENSNQTTSNSKFKILIAVAIIQFVIIVFLVIDKFANKSQTEQVVVQLEQTTQSKDSLNTQLENLLSQYQQLETNNDTLNEKLKSEQDKILKLIAEVKTLKNANSYKIAEYKAEIETLKDIMRSYIHQIDSLNTMNQNLIAENKQIKNNYTKVETEKKDLITKTDSLQNKVAVASVVKALNIKVLGLNKRDNETSRAKKTEKIQVCFTLNENMVAKKGTKDVFIRIARPDKMILTNDKSGMFIYQGQELAYSSRRIVDYQGEYTDVCIYWTTNQELPEGNYAADVFMEGNLIGTIAFSLK